MAKTRTRLINRRGGSGSLLDADTLDGIDSSGFVLAGSPINADTLDGIDSIGFVLAASVSGTAGRIPVFTSSGAIGNSSILDNGSVVTLNAGVDLKFKDTGGLNSVTIQPPVSLVASYSLVLPIIQAFEPSFLKNNGTGTLSFSSVDLTSDVSGTLPVAKGGSGVASATAYAVLCGGTTSTAAFQSITSVGTAGQVLTSNGAAALPTFQDTAAGGGSGEWFRLTGAPVPVTSGKVFSNTHVGAGSGMKHVDGLGVMASLDGDAIWAFTYKVPQTLPSGTRKLDLVGFANATSGNAKINVKWASAAYEEDWSSLTLNAEGTSTVSWGAGDADQAKNLQVTLDADTIVAGEYLIFNLTFENTSWTLAQVSTWLAGII